MTTNNTQLSEAQRDVVLDVLKAYSDQITYVVPRGHQKLPQSVPGTDLDIFVNPDEFEEAIELANSIGFVLKESKSSRFDLLVSAVEKPRRALELVIKNPSEVYKMVATGEHSSEETNPQYEQVKMLHDGFQLHLMNHITYESPLNGEQIRVNPIVENHMLEDRILESSWYIPEESDELAHLLCRGVFDYHGNFPEYYKERCDSLFNVVRNDSRQNSKFNELLELLYFDAGDLVYQSVSDSEYDNIRDALIQFENY